MFCQQCGRQNRDEARFCYKCGQVLAVPTIYQENPIPPPFQPSVQPSALPNDIATEQQAPQSTNNLGRRLLAAFLLCVLGVAVIISLGKTAQEAARSKLRFNGSGTDSTAAYSLPKVTIPHSQPLVGKAFTVGANSYIWFEFEIPSNAEAARIAGSFEAQGGSGNDVQVILTDSQGFTNFQNGHSFRSPYSTQKITTDTFNVPLSPGRYYLIFNNRFSVFTPKAVSAEIDLHWNQ